MRNVKLVVEYDGTDYCGWQRQENGRTIQGELENVLSKVLQENISVIGAGRTDAGVHARGQVANFRTNSNFLLHEIANGLNGLLPNDIVVREADEVPFEFHARYSAKEREYSYIINRVPTALMRNYSWYLTYDLKIEAIQWAAASIIGVHDFQSFCKANSDVDHHRCNVVSAQWREEGSILKFEIRADRFLHGMVRALVGTMVDVGRGFTTPDSFLKIMEQKDRTKAGMAAPARGLMLEKIVYS